MKVTVLVALLFSQFLTETSCYCRFSSTTCKEYAPGHVGESLHHFENFSEITTVFNVRKKSCESSLYLIQQNLVFLSIQREVLPVTCKELPGLWGFLNCSVRFKRPSIFLLKNMHKDTVQQPSCHVKTLLPRSFSEVISP